MPSPALSASHSRIPLPVNPATPMPASPRPPSGQRSPANSPRMRYRQIQALEDLQQQVGHYNRADLGKFGSVLRLLLNRVELVFTPNELGRLPCVLRDAERDIAKTLSKLKNGEPTHPIECNFDDAVMFLNRMDRMQPSLPKLAPKHDGEHNEKRDEKRSGKRGIEPDPAASDASRGMAIALPPACPLSPPSPLSPSSSLPLSPSFSRNSLDSCDLPSDLSCNSDGSPPAREPFPLFPSSASRAPGRPTARRDPGARLLAAAKTTGIAGHRKRMARIVQFNARFPDAGAGTASASASAGGKS